MTQLIGMSETAERLGLTLDSFRWLVHKGDAPPSLKVGRRRMFRPADVEAWIDDRVNVGRPF